MGSPYVALDGRTVLGLFLDHERSWDRMVVDTGSDQAIMVTREHARALLRS